jgi:hypothetical protein
LVDDGKVSKAQADFGMVRTEELFADPKGLHVALLGAKKIATLAENSTEVGRDEGSFAVDGAMATGRLFESAGEKNGSFFQLTGEFAQHCEIVEAHGHATLIAGKFVKIGRLGVVETGGLRLAKIFLGHGNFRSNPRSLGGPGATRQDVESFIPARKRFALVAARGGFVPCDLHGQRRLVPSDKLGEIRGGGRRHCRRLISDAAGSNDTIGNC